MGPVPLAFFAFWLVVAVSIFRVALKLPLNSRQWIIHPIMLPARNMDALPGIADFDWPGADRTF
jgi:hypothetical protein